MFFTSLLRQAEIGSNSYLLEIEDTRILLDAGMHPKREGLDSLPQWDFIENKHLDAVCLSHAHLDHSGGLPVVLREHPEALAYMTQATAKLIEALLHNSVNVMGKKRTELGITDYPFYTHRELDFCKKKFRTYGYERPFRLGEHTQITLHDAGHILGSAAISIETQKGKLLYTGDVQFENQSLIPKAQLPTEDIDVLIMETTRGDSPRPEDYAREKEEEAFAQSIERALQKGGAVLIPVFAMGKTQEVLTMLYKLKEAGRLEKAPIYIGGLSTKMTGIFDTLASNTPRLLPDILFLEDMDITTGRMKKKGAPITEHPGGIYALSSGMMTPKTLSNTFGRTFIQNPKNTLLFVGYADPATPAAAIRSASKGDSILLEEDMPPVPLHCDVEIFDFSGHATRNALLDYALKISPKKILLVHGDMPASTWFANHLSDKLPHTEILIPQPEKTYDLGL